MKKILLSALHQELSRQPPDVVGRLELSDDVLSLLDGQAELTVEVRDDAGAHPALAHCHILTRIRRWPEERLDACVVGIHREPQQALQDAARTWVESVAGPLLSLVHARPVMEARAFDGSQPGGVAGCRGFVGPMRLRLASPAIDLERFREARVFEYASAMAPPCVIHLAKVTLEPTGQGTWKRNLEIDGHAASHAERIWTQGPPAPAEGVLSQFAVFHFEDQPEFIERRRRTAPPSAFVAWNTQRHPAGCSGHGPAGPSPGSSPPVCRELPVQRGGPRG
ncbi:MAG: hypothetical protein HY319_13905 [Armatimonadetes bacterium]|nr:hypothetical protein [Armatimonadota bacterium]